MARKNILSPYLVSANQSLVADFTSPPTVVAYMDNCSYQLNVSTSDSVGSFFVQGSLDYKEIDPTHEVVNAGNWVDLQLSGNPTVNMANDTILIDLNQLPFNAIRVRYDATTPGTGTVNIYIMTKQVGG